MGLAGQEIQGLTKVLPTLAWFSAPGVPAQDLSLGTGALGPERSSSGTFTVPESLKLEH